MRKPYWVLFLVLFGAAGSVAAQLSGNAVPAPATGKQAFMSTPVDSVRIVFMGNSITEGWLKTDSAFFRGKAWYNKGISGHTTIQMLARFQEDVIRLQPSVVVILAGTNDIAGNLGYVSNDAIADNIISMCELAQHHNIRVVLCSVLPVYKYPWKPEVDAVTRVAGLNGRLREYATLQNITYVDFYSAMSDEMKGLKKELTYDGLHCTLAGYKVMEPLVEQGIRNALEK